MTMAEITAASVGKLRAMTGAGLMDCKKALQESNGELEPAADLLRKKGAASAAKKAGRDANEGVIVQHIQPGAKVGVLVEVNCETDFVARNESFVEFCEAIAKRIAENPDVNLEEDRVAAVARIGENIKIARHHRMEVAGSGLIAAYIHTGAKVGVLVEVGAAKEATIASEAFKQLVRDITLQIAAAQPQAVKREEVPADVLEKEKEIAAEQFKDKPPQAVEKIIQGKLEKFFQNICLVDQGFVKNGDLTVAAHIAAVAKELGDEIEVRRFVRFQVGEAI